MNAGLAHLMAGMTPQGVVLAGGTEQPPTMTPFMDMLGQQPGTRVTPEPEGAPPLKNGLVPVPMNPLMQRGLHEPSGRVYMPPQEEFLKIPEKNNYKEMNEKIYNLYDYLETIPGFWEQYGYQNRGNLMDAYVDYIQTHHDI